MSTDIRMSDGGTGATESPSATGGQTRPEGAEMKHPDIELGDLASSVSEQDDTDDEEDYETLRQRRMLENDALLAELGIRHGTNAVASSSSLPPAAKPRAIKKRKLRAAIFDRSGHIISLPNPGEKQVMACIELPRDRKVMRRITDGEYVDCSHWAEGEERRWRFGDGKNSYQQGEEVLVGGVGPDFRWRKWLGYHQELRNELVKRGEMNDEDVRGTRSLGPVDTNVSDYSLIPGSSCHQCRRKSEKEKMRCRNTQPECNASFCSTCCKRYSYFEFDPDSRSFICPLCRNICNCSNCIRKRDLAHLLETSGSGLKAESLTTKLRREGTGQTVEEYLQTVEENKMRVPFDRVRLVCQEEDIISPELPPEPVIVPVKAKSMKPKKSKKISTIKERPAGPKGSSMTKKKAKTTTNGTKSKSPLKLRFQVPTQPGKPSTPIKVVRPKEVDSDGDTVGGWSDDDHQDPVINGAQSPASSLTALSDLSVTPPRRLAFPPRPLNPVPDLSTTTSALLKVVDAAMDIDIDNIQHTGFMRPDMMHQAFPRQPDPVSHNQVPQVAKDHVNRTVETNGHANNLPSNFKRRRPPPAASIARAPKYMTHPHLTRNTPSASSSPVSSHSYSDPMVHTRESIDNGTATASESEVMNTSSPDPLSITAYLDPSQVGVKQSERRLADDIFLHNPPSPLRNEGDRDEDRLAPDDQQDRERDPLFPDTPLWYTYNHHPQQLSPPARETR